ncbi:MAG TPA: Na+/H+ antiporter subunit E, partial [Candidatus Synoicihabitans sp.]|nr:Na+/H+ antiporter subunit E [Candidatus Synoicihabitans sp.]
SSIRFRPFRWIIYGTWLLGQILLGAIHVAMVIISPSRHLRPRLIRVRMQQPNIFAAAALANSITVTPGTLTVDVVDDVFEVHVLTDRTAEDLLSGTMPERVARLFADTAPPPPLVITEETTGAPPLPKDRA